MKTYKKPSVQILGSFSELTLVVDKVYAPISDGYTLQGQNINVAAS
ncbi:MAG: hypothetical protein QM679_01260 [Patulibacter sp.]